MIRVRGEYYPKCSGIMKYNKLMSGMCLLRREPIPGMNGFTYEKDAIELWNKRAIATYINGDK